MPLSEHEQRILHEMEQTLYAHDPKFADRVRSETVYRYAGRNCKWAALGFVAGLVIMIVTFSSSVVAGFLGFLIMLGSAIFFERNLRRLGRAGWHDMTHTLGGHSAGHVLNEGWSRLQKRFRKNTE
ncbi:MAG: DUF3040 domain-containing protein [Actinobacteria bacterium]|nr:DUF3040 domain-containing protein [Actinomycetota bacterium]